jgi:hypothetical protein
VANKLNRDAFERLVDLAMEGELPRVRWTEGEAATAPPVAIELEAARKRLVRWLNLKGRAFNRPEARNLANRMAQCKPKQRCLSGACPVCSGAMQRVLLEASHRRRAKLQAANIACVAVTIIAKGVRYSTNPTEKEEGVRVLKTLKLKERMAKVLSLGKGHRAFGGIDLSLNSDARKVGEFEFEGPTFEPHWRPHLQVIMTRRSLDEVEEALRAEFPAHKLIPRPVVATDVDGNPSLDAYLLKRLFEPGRSGKRETYRRFRADGSRSEQTTRQVVLSVEERLDQLIYLDRLGLDGRLVFIGCRLELTDRGPSIEKIEKVKRA